MFGFSKLAASLFVIGVIALQFVFSFRPPHRYRYWPFMSYPMYNRAHAKDEPVANFSLVGILEGGEERAISPEDLKLDFWRYLRGPVRLAQKGEARALLALLQPYEHRTRQTLMAVRLENHPVHLVKGQLEAAPVETKTVVLRSRP